MSLSPSTPKLQSSKLGWSDSSAIVTSRCSSSSDQEFACPIYKQGDWKGERQTYHTYISSVTDPGCLSRIPDPGFFPSLIPDPKTATKERGEKKFVVIPFFVATNSTKFKIILFLNCWEKNLRRISKNYRTFTQKAVTKLSKIWVWDPGSEIRDPEKKPIPDPGSRGQKGTGPRIPCFHLAPMGALTDRRDKQLWVGTQTKG